MRSLSEEEQMEIERRRAGFDQFFKELMPILEDFIERLEIPDAAMVVADPDRFVDSVDTFMKDQVIEPDDRVWIITRIGYLVGEWLVQRFGGCWFVNEVPDSRYFACYVVGRFSGINNRSAMVDPMAVASAYVSEPPGRSLTATLHELENQLLVAG